ncbi:MAG: class I SAM-dependent methyltransferase [Candidatus Eisenbacteria bacterium]
MLCSLCKSTEITRKYHLPSLDVLECRRCGLVFIGGPAVPSSPANSYTQAYYEERSDYYYRNSVVDPEGGVEHGTIRDFRHGLDIINSLKQPGRILDVGCAMGIFPAMAGRDGWKPYGVDVSEFAIEFAKKHFDGEYFTGHLRDARFPDRFFDVITLWDSVEHFEDPLEELVEIGRVLKDDGILLFDTPNADSLMRYVAHWIYRLSGGAIHYPVGKLYHVYHRYYFSAATITRLLKQAGFRVNRLEKKTIPLVKARGRKIEKSLVRGLSWLERVSQRKYELFVIAVREDSQ